MIQKHHRNRDPRLDHFSGAALLPLLAASLVWPGSAGAQRVASGPGSIGCRDDPTACGRRAFDAGVDAYKRGAFREALSHFEAAYEIRQYPIILYNLALTEEKLGLFVEALAHLRELAAAPDRTRDLVGKAKEIERRATRQIATLTLEVPDARGAKLFVDDREMPDVEDARVNPGLHGVRVVDAGTEHINREIELRPGEHRVLTLDPSSQPSSGQPEHGPDLRSPGLDPLWFYAGVGVTLAAAGVTVWSGIDTVRAKQRFDDGRPYSDKSEERKLLDDGHARERRTNIMLGATAVLAVGTGALGLFAVDWSRADDKGVSLLPGVGGALLVGRY